MNSKTEKLVFYALFAAFTAILSQIAIPLPFTPVPVNLATLSVVLSGALLGPIGGMMSQLIYILIGAVGLPVFSGFTGGLGVLIGPTGGYLFGYLFCALVTGALVNKVSRKQFLLLVAIIAGILVCYIVGTIWFIFVMKTTILNALLLCVAPFLLGDGIKIAVAFFLTIRLGGKRIG